MEAHGNAGSEWSLSLTGIHSGFDVRYCNTVLLISDFTDIRGHKQNELSILVFSDGLQTLILRYDCKAGTFKVKIGVL